LPQATLPAQVPWSNEGLKWDYFHEVLHIDYGGKDPLALTWSKVYYELSDTLSFQNKIPGVVVSVYAVMIPSKSYVKASANRTGLLEHEQIHFDIAELCARKIRKELSETIFYQKNYWLSISAIYQKYQAERRTMNELYDAQHRDKNWGHYYWRSNIDGQLIGLKKFADTKIFATILPL
jgi:hypothetical protein